MGREIDPSSRSLGAGSRGRLARQIVAIQSNPIPKPSGSLPTRSSLLNLGSKDPERALDHRSLNNFNLEQPVLNLVPVLIQPSTHVRTGTSTSAHTPSLQLSAFGAGHGRMGLGGWLARDLNLGTGTRTQYGRTVVPVLLD
eukprot:SAG31_NODE_22809_length_517_cov_0.985646_1_plen_141_part_00